MSSSYLRPAYQLMLKGVSIFEEVPEDIEENIEMDMYYVWRFMLYAGVIVAVIILLGLLYCNENPNECKLFKKPSVNLENPTKYAGSFNNALRKRMFDATAIGSVRVSQGIPPVTTTISQGIPPEIPQGESKEMSKSISADNGMGQSRDTSAVLSS